MCSIDVVIPCYNYAHFLRQSVASVLGQEGVKVRVLIIDDCSTDDSEAVGLALAREDDRVEFRRHPKNRGHIATYNEGLLEWASAEYSLLLSADDAVAPGAFTRAVKVLNRHREVGMIYGMALVLPSEQFDSASIGTVSDDYRIVNGAQFLEHCITRGNAVETPTAVVRTELQHRVGGYRPELPHSGDMEMWMRFAVHAPVAVLRAVQAYVRRHSANMSTRYYRQLLGDSQEVIRACDEILIRWGERFPDSASWRETMMRRMAEDFFWKGSDAFDAGDPEQSETFLQIAGDFCPHLRSSPMWRRFYGKKLLGQTLWRLILPALDQLCRGGKPLPDREPAEASEPGHLSGWWPELSKG